MNWLLAIRRISTRLIDSPFTETDVVGANSLAYTAGVEPVRNDGQEPGAPLGTFERGLHRASGFIFSADGDAAQHLLAVDVPVSLIAYYTAAGNEARKRTFIDVVFAGDATIRIGALNTGLGDLVGVPFRVNIPEGETLTEHIMDEADT